MSNRGEERFVRPDALGKTLGEARYTADVSFPGMLHARLLLAHQASAIIRRLDTSRARSLPGVACVITQADMPPVRYGLLVKDRTLFAHEVVRFPGEVIAAVAATTEELAKEACRLIECEFEPVEPVVDAEAALIEGSQLVHEDWSGYSQTFPGIVRHGNDTGYVTIVKGDAEQAFAGADVVVEERYVADSSHGVAIEPHAVVARWQGDRVTVWSSSQVPYAARSGIAEALDIPQASVRVVVPTLGGGFGSKCEMHFEPHVAALAKAAGRAVRLVLTRREVFTAIDMTRHAVVTEVRTGLSSDGTILARTARHVLDTGAYASHGPIIAELATLAGVGPYRIPNLVVEAHTVYTNKTPAGSVRAPSGPQVCWAIEQHTDECARRLGIDPLEFRLKNILEDGDEGPTGQHLSGVSARTCLLRAAEAIGWGERRARNEGLGLACGWWSSFPAPSAAHVQLNPDGSATIVTGAQENGSGAVMGLALLVAEELGVDVDRVSILHQDTDAAPWDMGSAGSQTTFNNGRAVVDAARQVRGRLLELACEELEASAGDIELVAGSARVAGSPDRAVSVASLVGRAMQDGELLLASGGSPPPPRPQASHSNCVGRLFFPSLQAPSFFAQAATVDLDHETGVVTVKDIVAVHDFGRVLNPVGAQGQVAGGVAHGIGMALTEGTQVRDGHQANANLVDYKLTTSADVPEIRVEFVGQPAADGGPGGLKGLGEPPVVPTAGAIANAIADASGVRVRRLPMTPPRIWATINAVDD